MPKGTLNIPYSWNY